jgi:hypothetical protein
MTAPKPQQLADLVAAGGADALADAAELLAELHPQHAGQCRHFARVLRGAPRGGGQEHDDTAALAHARALVAAGRRPWTAAAIVARDCENPRAATRRIFRKLKKLLTWGAMSAPRPR